VCSLLALKCAAAAEVLIGEMKSRFPSHSILDALGVVYPQYWLQGDCEVSFMKHLNVLKDFYREPKWIGEGVEKRLIPPVLDRYRLESEQPLFKVAMMANSAAALELPPIGTGPGTEIVNPLTKIWRQLDANTSLAKVFPEYIKLAHIAMVHVLGSVEDECAFSSLNFLKDKQRNRLDSHLSLVMGMRAQNVYTLKKFPYDDCFKQWVHSAEQYRYGTVA
jgi:hypothetical protein